MEITTAVVGLGRWGRNLVRVFDEASELAWCCNKEDASAHAWVEANHPGARTTFDYEAVLADDAVDAVALATPIATHAEMARSALEAGKHVFVEKPLATSSKAAEDLVALARERGLVLFTGHVFRYHPAFNALQDRIDPTDIEHVAIEWRKLGSFGSELVWNLLPHPLSIVADLIPEQPTELDVRAARGRVTSLDQLRIAATFETDRSAIVDIDRTASVKRWRVTVDLQDGRRYDWVDDDLHAIDTEGDMVEIEHNDEEPLVRETRAFLARVRDRVNGGVPTDPDQGSHDLRVVAWTEHAARQVGSVGIGGQHP